MTNRSEIRALTLWQPWASCIAYGTKRIENRSWPTDYRGTLLIHAGRYLDPKAKYVPLTHPFLRRRQPFGAVVAIAQLVSCHADDGYCTLWSASGCWHWRLANVRRLARPVLWSGARGLWIPPADLLATSAVAELLEVPA